MRVLLACEYSGVSRRAFEARGHEVLSCDFLPADDGAPNHYQGDVFDVINDGWHLMIAHPPCTYLTGAAEWCYKDNPGKKMRPGVLFGQARREAREQALDFFRRLMDAPIERIGIENPVGVAGTRIRKADQIIQPWMFGDDASKATCLWLKNLPTLVPTKIVMPRIVNGKKRWANQTDSGQNRLGPSEDRWKIRSVTYAGVADAWADQWGCLPAVEDNADLFTPSPARFNYADLELCE